jgi:putative DNA primase/helicase
MRRRFNIVPFIRKPVAPDRLLEEKLRAEWGQILGWAIRGCRLWLANGLARPDAVRAATDEYFEDQDVFGQWFAERCIELPGRWDTVANFYGDWAKFAKERGEEAGSNKSFGTAMKKRGFMSRPMRSSGAPAKVYQGVALQYAEGGRDD